MSPNHTLGEVAAEAMKATPPVSVAGLLAAGVTLDRLVMLATLVYTVLQIGWFVYSKIIRKTDDGSGK